MNSQIGSVLAEGMQSRRTAGRNTPIVAVMAGLSELAHFEQGLCAPSPLDIEPEVSSDLRFAVNKIIEAPNNIDKWRGGPNAYFSRGPGPFKAFK